MKCRGGITFSSFLDSRIDEIFNNFQTTLTPAPYPDGVMKLIYHDIECYIGSQAARCLALARKELGALRRRAGLPRSSLRETIYAASDILGRRAT